jgi:hypothetical protein
VTPDFSTPMQPARRRSRQRLMMPARLPRPTIWFKLPAYDRSCQYLDVRFHAEHRFNASMESIGRLLAEPSFYLDLDLPDLSRPDLLESHEDGRISVVRLRYTFVGPLDPITHRLIGSNPLAWIQELRIDRRAGSGALHFEAELDPSRLHGTGDFVLAETSDGTVIRFDGDLMIGIPGIGRLIERQILLDLIRFHGHVASVDHAA